MRKNIQLAYPLEEKRLKKWTPPYLTQPKLDGIRCRREPNSPLILSSEENPIWGVPHINSQLRESNINGHELDGELYKHGWSFEKISGITSREVNLHHEHELLEYHVFDIINDSIQGDRICQLSEISTRFKSRIKMVPFDICESFNDIMDCYNDYIENGYEGIIVRNFTAIYRRSRSIYMMKFKPKKEDIYEIVGYKEETSISRNPKGRLGSIICRKDGRDFSVGSGFSDRDREALWSVRETLERRKLRVQYQHITNKNKVPRFPIFMEVIE